MVRLKIIAQKRKVLGRKVKALRREGILPANLFGKGIKSQALQLDRKKFMAVFEKVGETGLADLVVGKQKPRPVLISNVQLHPISDEPLHVDFHQVDLKEKTTAAVEIRVIGTAPAVEKEEGVLVQTLSEVEVEALPADLPDHLEADISSLKAIDDAIRVKDLRVDKGVEIKAGANEIVVKISAPVKEEETAPKEEEAVEKTAEEGEKKEGEAPSPDKGEGEKTVSGQKEQAGESKPKDKEGKE